MSKFIATNLDCAGKPEFILDFPVDFVAHINVPINKENDDVDIFKLIVYHFFALVANRLESPQKLHDKVHVELIIQMIVGMFVLVINLFELKDLSKLVEEPRKEELGENGHLNLTWQLL
jgi:hypothetical protein